MNHDPYSELPDLRQLMVGRNTRFLPAISQTPVVEPFSFYGHRSLTVAPLPATARHYDQFCNDRMELESGYNLAGNETSNNGRWPRQETLTLLEIRSRLNFKFKEANQKGPLWDEVSRIMSEENGYERSGKKCREKFENLYKYYKKTKEGKAGRQDGKNYRFFRQLDAIYGESSNLTNREPSSFNWADYNNTSRLSHQNVHEPRKFSESLSFSEYSSETPSFETKNEEDLSAIALMMSGQKRKEKRTGRGPRWKAKVKEFVEMEMRKVMGRQEEWMERMVRSIESKEKERMWKEEERRRQEVARLDGEHQFWAKERAWLEARDVALMEALNKITGDNVVSRVDEINGMMRLQQQQQQQVEDLENGVNNVGYVEMNNVEMWWDKYGLKLSNTEKYHQG